MITPTAAPATAARDGDVVRSRSRRSARTTPGRHQPSASHAEALQRHDPPRRSRSPRRRVRGGARQPHVRRHRRRRVPAHVDGRRRPTRTSSLNADAAGHRGANSSVVPLDTSGRFMLESTMTGRVIVDVMALARRHATASTRRPVRGPDPDRLVDTRDPGRHQLESGSDNPYSRQLGSIEFYAAGGSGGAPSTARPPAPSCCRSQRSPAPEPGGLRRRPPDGQHVGRHVERQRRHR